MSRVNDYRRAMNGLRPSPAWRRRTLAAMEEAAAGTRRARPVRHPLRRAAVLAAVFLAAFVGALWFTAQSLPWSSEFRSARPGVTQAPRPGQLERREGVYTFLLAATSPSSDLTDCMMAVTYNSREQTVRLLSLPRDTQIDAVRVSDGGPLTHLNYVYAENGVEALRAQAAGLLGYPIDYYVIIDPQGFVELVDAMGGVEFNVPQDMDYEDWTQDIHIHLDAGVQLLDGAEALGAALFRHTSDSEGHTLDGYPNGDLDRTAVQRELLAAVLERALSQPQHFPDYVSLFLEHVETDLTAPELLELAGKAVGLELPGALEGFLLPGDPGDTPAMYAPDAQEIRELVNAQRFHPYTSDLPAPTPLVSDPDGTAEPPMPDDVWFLPDAAYWLGSTFSMTYFPSDRTAAPDAGRYLDAFPSLPVYDNRTTGLDDARPIGQRVAGALGTSVVSDSWDAGEGCGRYQAVLADGSKLTLQGRTDLHVELPPGADKGTVQRALEALNTPAGESELEQEFLAEAFLDMSYAEDLSYCDCTVIPEAYTRYSIRPAEAAVALFRSGDYWSAMHTAYPEQAEILEVRLTYLTEPYMEQLQPVYAIYFTQDYWEVYEDGTNWMGSDYAAWPEGMIPAAVAYVPAVEGLTFQYRSDEGRDLHRTPAVTDDVWSLSDAGGWITIVEDPAQQMGSNPTEGRLDELTELPVYYNQKPTEAQQTARVEALAGELGLTITSSRWYEGTAEPSQGWSPSLWADCADGSALRLYGLYTLELLGDTPPPEALYGLYNTAADTALWSTEAAEAYSFDGTQSISRSWFYDDPGASLEQQLYNYSFLRFSTTESGRTRLMLPPAYIWDTYPICTAAEAVAQFRSGDYWSTMETAYPERAEILQVTLEYAAEDYQAFFQPVYRILFTQDYWDAYLAEWMGDGADVSRFTGVAAAYVPAVDGLDFRMYANDTEVHRTPS